MDGGQDRRRIGAVRTPFGRRGRRASSVRSERQHSISQPPGPVDRRPVARACVEPSTRQSICSPKLRSAPCGATGAMRAAFVAHLRRRLRLGEVALYMLCILRNYKEVFLNEEKEETLPESCGAETPGSAFCTQPARLNVRTGNRKQVRESMGGVLSRRFEMFTRQHTGCGI